MRIGLPIVFLTFLTTAACAGSSRVDSGSSGGAAASGEAGGATQGGGGSGATGGDNSGGGNSAGGAGASGGSGGAPPVVAECTDDSDCKLVNDCCSCLGIPTSRQDPDCDLSECLIPHCQSLEFGDLQNAQCRVGRCVAGFTCDHTEVTCESVPPNCPPGETPSALGDCWGKCVATTECESVGSCDQCDTNSEQCVRQDTQLGAVYHCVDKPEACDDNPSCACMGASVCLAPYDTCNDTALGITCSCLTC